MDYKKFLGPVIAIVLSIAGALLGYNLKGEVCGPSEKPANPAPVHVE